MMHAPYWGMPGFEHTLPLFGFAFLPVIAVLALWTIIIKGFGLWYSARNDQKTWFVVMLLVNLVGIPELIYLLWFRADKKVPGAAETSAHNSQTAAE